MFNFACESLGMRVCKPFKENVVVVMKRSNHISILRTEACLVLLQRFLLKKADVLTVHMLIINVNNNRVSSLTAPGQLLKSFTDLYFHWSAKTLFIF